METPEKSSKILSCKLIGSELQKHKREVLNALKAKVLERQEVANGYQYTFDGSDELLEQLFQFIKTERACCSFFTFELSVKDNASPALLTITGPDGAKEFITAALNL